MTYSAEVLTDLPVFYWKLDDASGTVAVDSSGNGNDGTYSVSTMHNGSGLIAGDAGSAAINDPTQYVSTPNSPSYFASTINAWTMEIIVSVSNAGGGDQLFGSVPASPFFNNGGGGHIQIDGWSGTATAGFDLTLNTTYHLCATFDGTTLILYVDGTALASAADLPISGGATGPWDVGYRNGSGAGTYEHAAYYDHALSPTRVAAHVAASGISAYKQAVLADGPAVYWRLDELSGTVAADSSGNSHSGTYTGSPTLGTSGLLAGDPDTAITINNNNTDYVISVDDFGNTTYAAFTLECCVEFATADSGQQPVGVIDSTYSFWIVFYTGVPVGGLPVVHANWVGTTRSNDYQSSPITLSAPHHLALTFDGTTTTLYVDGVATASGNDSTIGAANFAGILAHFCAGGDNTGDLDGLIAGGIIDEPAFYNYALSGARVLAHATAGGFVSGGPSVPTVTNLSPNFDVPAGGSIITVTGTAFTGTTAVYFGATSVAFTFINDTTLTATDPAGALGTSVHVTVTNATGTSTPTSADLFYYLLTPTVTNVSPSSDLPTGGSTITITGTGFTGVTAVFFGATSVAFTFLSDTSLTATDPSGTAGTSVHVTVTVFEGSTNVTSNPTSADLFSYVAAVVAAAAVVVERSAGLPTTAQGSQRPRKVVPLKVVDKPSVVSVGGAAMKGFAIVSHVDESPPIMSAVPDLIILDVSGNGHTGLLSGSYIQAEPGLVSGDTALYLANGGEVAVTNMVDVSNNWTMTGWTNTLGAFTNVNLISGGSFDLALTYHSGGALTLNLVKNNGTSDYSVALNGLSGGFIAPPASVLPSGVHMWALTYQKDTSTVYSTDSFNRANATSIGSTDGHGSLDPLPWTYAHTVVNTNFPAPSGMEIFSNEVVPYGTVMRYANTVSLGISNLDINVTFVPSFTGGVETGITFRYTDIDNCWFCCTVGDSINIFKRVAGVETQVANMALPGVGYFSYSEGLMDVHLQGSQITATIYYNSTLSATVTVSDGFNSGATSHGLMFGLDWLTPSVFSFSPYNSGAITHWRAANEAPNSAVISYVDGAVWQDILVGILTSFAGGPYGLIPNFNSDPYAHGAISAFQIGSAPGALYSDTGAIHDENAFWSRVLTPTEIAGLYVARGSFSGYSAAVLALAPSSYYHLDEAPTLTTTPGTVAQSKVRFLDPKLGTVMAEYDDPTHNLGDLRLIGTRLIGTAQI